MNRFTCCNVYFYPLLSDECRSFPGLAQLREWMYAIFICGKMNETAIKENEKTMEYIHGFIPLYSSFTAYEVS